MKQYTLLTCRTYYDLREAVSAAMQDGWEPLGGASVSSGEEGNCLSRRGRERRSRMYFIQSMLKEDEDD